MMMSAKARPQVSAVVATGVLVSVGMAVIPALVTSTSGNFSLAIGLIGVCITLLLEVIVRIDRRERAIHRAFEMVDALGAVPTMADDLQHSAASAAAIAASDTPALFRASAEKAIAECRQQLDHLLRGECIVNSGSAPVLIDLARNAKSSIRATSIIAGNTGDEAWWRSPGGQEYWKENVRALKRKVSITRVYIFEGSPSTEMEDILRRQEGAGVKVLRVERSRIPSELAINVVIVDEKTVHEIVASEADGVLQSLHVNPNYVRTANSKFDELVQRIFARRFI